MNNCYIKYRKLKLRVNDQKFKRQLILLNYPPEEQKIIKKTFIKNQTLNIMAMICFWLTLIFQIVLISIIDIKGFNTFLTIIFVIAKLLGYIVALAISVIVAALICKKTTDLSLNKNYNHQALKQLRIKYCQKHREYYQLTSHYLITTCYECFNPLFNNRPICLFRNNDQISFCVDIVNGFINKDKDLGCYSFLISDCHYQKSSYQNHPVLIITIGKDTLIVHYHAIKIFKDLNK